MAYWLVKSDPETYSWDDLVKNKKTDWDGVRNYQARNYLREMKKGDKVLVYHSNIEKAIMGIAEVSKEAFQDPTTDDERWLAVELKAIKPLKNQITLEQIKNEPKLSNIGLVKQGRLSVMPISDIEWKLIVKE